jgi:hypothetical protein
MKRSVTSGALVAFLAGCAPAPPQPTREEYLAHTTREFKGIDKEKALAAAERVLRLADADDFQIAHTQDGFVATRPWLVYLVLAAANGTDVWQVTTQPLPNGVRMAVQVSTAANAITGFSQQVSGGAGGSVATPITIPGNAMPAQGFAVYDVFWARLEYVLGLRQTWMTCVEANDRVTKKIVWGNNDALCNVFNVKDTNPVTGEDEGGKEPATQPVFSPTS